MLIRYKQHRNGGNNGTAASHHDHRNEHGSCGGSRANIQDRLARFTLAGVAGLCLGIALNARAAYSMIKAKTPINPYQSVATIVASGAFRLSRNPLYVGLDLIFLGLAFIVNSLWGVLVLVPVLLVMHYGVILREERYLEAKFGEPYRRYRATVRRYF